MPDGSVPEPEERPEYKNGVYSNQYFKITDDEKTVMKLRSKQLDPDLGKIANEVLVTQGKSPAVMSDDEKRKFFSFMIKCDVKKTELVDLEYHSQYLPEMGFRFNIEAIQDNKQKGFLCALVSISPKAMYYDNQRDGPPTDIDIITAPDYTCHSGTYRYNEGIQLFKGASPDKPGMSILIDIKIYLPEKDQF